MELQQRIPDRWFFRRLLPSAMFVVVAAVCGGRLGQAHWDDLGLAKACVTNAFRVGGTGSGALSSLVLLAIAVAVCALAVPVAAAGVDLLASGAWPWWLAPVGERLREARSRRRHDLERRWRRPGDRSLIERESILARSRRQFLRAARLDAQTAVLAIPPPSHPTWCGDRFQAARDRIRKHTEADIAAIWTDLKLTMPDSARSMLTASRDAYDAACEAVVWSAAITVLGVWWWPALPAGLVLGLASWRWLRRAVTVFCETTEAAAIRYYPGNLTDLQAAPSIPAREAAEPQTDTKTRSGKKEL